MGPHPEHLSRDSPLQAALRDGGRDDGHRQSARTEQVSRRRSSDAQDRRAQQTDPQRRSLMTRERQRQSATPGHHEGELPERQQHEQLGSTTVIVSKDEAQDGRRIKKYHQQAGHRRRGPDQGSPSQQPLEGRGASLDIEFWNRRHHRQVDHL